MPKRRTGKIDKKDQKQLAWNVEVEDLFGTHATILDLIQQNIEASGYDKESGEDIASLVNEWLYLQQAYTTVIKSQRPPKKVYVVSCKQS